MNLQVLTLLLTLPAALNAQPPIMTGPGWEGFPHVEYQGGDATQMKKLEGILVLTDSTVALHQCVYECTSKGGRAAFFPTPLYVIRLRTITVVNSASAARVQDGERPILEALLDPASADDLLIVYETEQNAEAPHFRAQKTQSAAIEAKIRFRLKKMGIVLTEKGK